MCYHTPAFEQLTLIAEAVHPVSLWSARPHSLSYLSTSEILKSDTAATATASKLSLTVYYVQLVPLVLFHQVLIILLSLCHFLYSAQALPSIRLASLWTLASFFFKDGLI